MTEREATGSDGRSIALDALKEVAQKKATGDRLSDATLERIVDIAWRHQFTPADRAKARNEIREVLQPEISKRVAGNE